MKAGKKQSRITLPHISELPAYLILKKQRSYCKACNVYFTAQSSVVDKFCFISKNTKMAVLNKATDIRSEASIIILKKTTGVSRAKIRRLKKRQK
ncbi:hypothetical protein HHH54_09375 [Staphylococcus sp. H16/1A]|uniref:Transposase n=1 Tax=Staphylococcus canis TaxID=2724942 RepID=A0ABS0TCV7_9STAP|nr:hypothetical protein [Staphylococcus canis]